MNAWKMIAQTSMHKLKFHCRGKVSSWKYAKLEMKFMKFSKLLSTARDEDMECASTVNIWKCLKSEMQFIKGFPGMFSTKSN